MLLTQSASDSQLSPTEQGPHAPPQSISVSSASFVPFAQVAATHFFAAVSHRGVGAEQWLSWRHSTQWPVPSHTEPCPPVQGTPAGAGEVTGAPSSQPSAVQALLSSSGSLSLIGATAPFWQTFFLQSPWVCAPAAEPSGTGSSLHVPARQTARKQGSAGTGQSATQHPATQSGTPPVPPPPPPPPPGTVSNGTRSWHPVMRALAQTANGNLSQDIFAN